MRSARLVEFADDADDGLLDVVLSPGFACKASSEGAPLPPAEPEWFDGEEVYTIYRPSQDDAELGGLGIA